MAKQLAEGLGREALAFDKGIVGECGAQGFAPADAFLHSLACGGDSHGIKPPTLFGSESLPVANGVVKSERGQALIIDI